MTASVRCRPRSTGTVACEEQRHRDGNEARDNCNQRMASVTCTSNPIRAIGVLNHTQSSKNVADNGSDMQACRSG